MMSNQNYPGNTQNCPNNKRDGAPEDKKKKNEPENKKPGGYQNRNDNPTR